MVRKFSYNYLCWLEDQNQLNFLFKSARQAPTLITEVVFPTHLFDLKANCFGIIIVYFYHNIDLNYNNNF